MRHSSAEKSYEEQARQELAASLKLGMERLSAVPLEDAVWVKVDRDAPPWMSETQPARRRSATANATHQNCDAPHPRDVCVGTTWALANCGT